MDIRVSGHQMATGAALQAHAQDRLGAIVDKYFSRALSSHVTFGKAHVALDQAAEKIDTQLRRYKRRLKDRSEASTHAMRVDEAAYTVFEEPALEADEIGADAAVVIAETRVDVPEATVSDAVMMLDLRNTNALLFRNAGTGVHNMVYRRGDGSIGWVEPKPN
jgi:ribosome-associated translation inhibitor RaiA